MTELFSKNRNFRSLLLFSTFSGIGRGIFSMFMVWVVHAIYQNPMYTGIAGFMFSAPLVASFIVGPFVDRWNKVTVLRITGFIKLCVTIALFLTAHIMDDYPGAWLFFLAILIFSISSLFSTPAYTALLPRVVDGKDLIKANALMTMVGVVCGLGVGALLYILLDGGAEFAVAYGVNSAVLLLALLFAALLHSNESYDNETTSDKSSLAIYLNELKTGFSFVKKGVMLPLVTAAVSMNFFARVAYVNLPMFAELHFGTASGYIILSALAMAGALIGSYISKAVESKFELWKIFVGCFILAGVTRILFVSVITNDLQRAIWIYILYIGIGSTIGIFYRALVQKLPPKSLISRVDTTITSLAAIATAIGALVGGLLGTHLPTVDMVFIIQGISYITIGVCLLFSKQVRELSKVGALGENSSNSTA